MVKLGIICGGPSLERGISLNSARSAMDHIIGMDITVYYINPKKEVYHLDKQHLYSNTPEDFDFKISALARPLSEAEWILSMKKLDLIFPIMHGEYGEDGELQAILEKAKIPFVGSNAKTTHNMFHKNIANKILKEAGYPTLPCCLVEGDNWHAMLEEFGKVVIKPQAGGSSIGVSIVSTIEQGEEAIKRMPDKKMICEAFCDGKEFIVTVLATDNGPVSIIPVEINIEEKGAFYDYRRKYLPTNNTHWLCPPTFSHDVVAKIQEQAEKIFTLFGMNDFIRMDGWVKDGQIIFSDINPISGMEQNSLLFLQASRLGMTHQDLFDHIIQQSAKRQGVTIEKPPKPITKREPIAILFGGATEERQISLMSGTNVWLKLIHSEQYEPIPYLLDKDMKVWKLPYTYALTHTVEEIYECLQSQAEIRDYMEIELPKTRARLGLKKIDISEVYPQVVPISIEDFISMLSENEMLFFNALHGGFGENGSLQAMLDNKQVSYNGSGVATSALGMDKYAFAKAVNLQSIPKMCALEKSHVLSWKSYQDLERVVIKPRSMGCSYGVQMIDNEKDFEAYVSSCDKNEKYIVEPFIETDDLYYEGTVLKKNEKTGWLELTLVVCETNDGYQALYPSITISVDAILSVEEKFQGGTGVNITPPPEFLISEKARTGIQKRFEILSERLDIKHYVRYDFFYNTKQDNIIVIEMNTLPALTPATVLYHQMLATGYAKTPMHGLEKLVELQKETVQ